MAKIQRQLDRWNPKYLSIVGREELIHGVITPMVLYWLLTYELLEQTIDKINKFCLDFFLAGKKRKR